MARDTGEQVYREVIHYHVRPDIYEEQPTCVHCNKRETIADLRGISPGIYVTGKRIIGDLEELGWMFIRGVRIDEETYNRIRGVLHIGRGWHGTWYPVQSDGSKLVMRFKHISTPPTQWSSWLLNRFTEELTALVINKINPNKEYMIGKFNLLKNDYYITNNQQPHKDYPPRMNT